MPLSRLYAIVSTSSLRTVTLCPTACETSVSAAVAPADFAASRIAAATRSSVAVDTGKWAFTGASPARFEVPPERATLNDVVIDGLCVRMPRHVGVAAPLAKQGASVGYDSKASVPSPHR